MEELKRQLENLKSDLNKVNEELKTYRTKMEDEVKSLRRVIENHTHGGNDGSRYIYNDGIVLKPGQQFQTGNMAVAELTTSEHMLGALIVGSDTEAGDGSQNAQLTIEHIPSTNGSTNNTFMYGLRSPIVTGTDGQISSGGTTLTTEEFKFDTNALAGAFISVENPDDEADIEGFEIASNTQDTITITGGSWGFSSRNNAVYNVFVPIYFGAAQFPWRRLYTLQGNGGGVRFGLGATAGGQNGLLYMNDDGDIVWRNPSGSLFVLN